MFESIVNPIFAPLLKFNPLYLVLIVSLIMTVLVTLAYKYLTNQELMKSLKTELKEHQKKIKEHRSDPKKAMHLQKKAMESNMKYMMHSFKPMIFTIIPILIIFGWLNAHLAYEQIMPNEKFTTTAIFGKNVNGDVELVVPEGIDILDGQVKKINGAVTWELQGDEGEYLLEYKFDDKLFSKDVLITNEKEYSPVIKKIKDNELKTITIDNEKLKILNLFGWKLGWLGTYIIISIVFSMILRKALKIY